MFFDVFVLAGGKDIVPVGIDVFENVGEIIGHGMLRLVFVGRFIVSRSEW
jgi:hypothetical protein